MLRTLPASYRPVGFIVKFLGRTKGYSSFDQHVGHQHELPNIAFERTTSLFKTRISKRYCQVPEKSINTVQLPQNRFLVTIENILKVGGESTSTFGPRIDIERANPFLPADPKVLIKEKRFNAVPTIMGVNANEGAYFLASKHFKKNQNE